MPTACINFTEHYVLDQHNVLLDVLAMSVIAEQMQKLGLSDAEVSSVMQVSREAVRLWRLGKRFPAINKVGKLAALIEADVRAIRPDLTHLNLDRSTAA